MTEFLNQTIHGLTLGALFALVAVGYTMVFGIIKLINFAHGEFYMAGGIGGMLLLQQCAAGRLEGLPGGLKLFAVIVLAGAGVAGLAMLTERLAYRPIRGSGRISALLTAVGVSLLLQNLGIAVFGSKQITVPEVVENERFPRGVVSVNLDELAPEQFSEREIFYKYRFRYLDGSLSLDKEGNPIENTDSLVKAGEAIDPDDLEKVRELENEGDLLQVYTFPAIEVRTKQLIIFGSLLIATLGLYILVQKTRTGRAMRAVSHDMQAASLMGIDCNRIVLITFAAGGALAGMGGVLNGMFITTVDPMMGFMFGLKAFIAAVLGGIGNIPGALLGGLMLGLVEQYAQNYANLLFPGASSYRDAITFLILIAVLLVRPRGFLGRIEGEKV